MSPRVWQMLVAPRRWSVKNIAMCLSNQGPKVTGLEQKSSVRSHICYDRMLEQQESEWRLHVCGLELMCSYRLNRSLTGLAQSESRLEKCCRVGAHVLPAVSSRRTPGFSRHEGHSTRALSL
ncbi:hypothetical protein NDU88_005163 [Pleurodeles waltl]|uniref:Uncharacterized protein n=1 Tax=Pleurodeles waltl TaxID=8319 RepID=A0AAV7TBT5_PLEWA|nr:hypothetical protein NDU88_005163 [Pleurodeles waltl]